MNLKKYHFRLSVFLKRFFVAVAVIFVWRGTWNLLDLYFFPETHPLSNNILSIAVGIVILLNPLEIPRPVRARDGKNPEFQSSNSNLKKRCRVRT